MKKRKKKVDSFKFGPYTSSSFYYPSFLDMKDPYFVYLRDRYFADKRRADKRFGVKTEYRIPHSEDIVLNDNSLEETLELLQ